MLSVIQKFLFSKPPK